MLLFDVSVFVCFMCADSLLCGGDISVSVGDPTGGSAGCGGVSTTRS